MDLPIPTKTGERVVYDLLDGSIAVKRRQDGSFYGVADSFDFTAFDEADLRNRLRQWGAVYVGLER